MKKHKLTSLILVIPLLAMAAGSIAFLMKVGFEIRLTLPRVLKRAISERINGSVQFGRIGLSASGITIHDLVIADASKKPVVTAPLASVEFDLSGLVKSDPLKSIKSVDFHDPRIFMERQPDGRWNIQGLVKPRTAVKPIQFGGVIHLYGGRLTVLDRLARLRTPVRNEFSHVAATVDFSEKSVAVYSVSGQGPAGLMGKFTAKGQYNLIGKSLIADLSLVDASASYWTKYPANLGLDILSGRADATARFSKAQDRPLAYSSDIKLRDGSIRFQPIGSPVKNISGDVNVRHEVVNLDLTASIGSSAFTAVGDVTDFKHPMLALELAFTRINIREVIGMTAWSPQFREASLPRSGRMRARVVGPPKSFSVDFVVDAPTLAYKGYGGQSVRASGRYAGRQIRIDQATAIAFGGSLQGQGNIDFTHSTHATFTGWATGLQASEVPFLRNEGLTSSSDGRFQMTAQKSGMTLDYQGSMSSIRYGGLNLDHGRIDVSYAGGGVTVNDFSAGVFGGSVAASGTIGQSGVLDVQASGSGINLAEILKGRQPAVGRVGFSGRISGNVKSPVFEGDVSGDRVMVAEVGVQRIAGKAYASRDRITLTDLTFYDYPGALVVNGTVKNPTSKEPDLSLSVTADALDISRLPKIGGPAAPVTGMLFGDLTVTGTSAHPTVEGDFHVQGAAYQNTPLDTLMVKLGYGDEGFRLESFQVTSGDSSLVGNGAVTRDGDISAEFQGDHIAMAQFSPMLQPYAKVAGNLSLSGMVGGKTTDPTANVEVASDSLTINGQAFKDFSANASLDKKVITLSALSLSSGKSTYTIPELVYDPGAKVIKANLEVHDGSAGQILALLDASPAVRKSGALRNVPRPLTGTVNASLSGTVGLDGDKPKPDAQADVTLTGMQFGTGKAESIKMAGNWHGDVITLDSLEAIQGDTNVSGKGSVGPGDSLSIEVDAHNLSMDTLRQWVSLPVNFTGNADVTLVAGGTRANLNSEAYVEIVDPVLGGVKFDRLRSRLTANQPEQNGRIAIDDLTLTLDNHDLRVTGYVPIDWNKLTVPKDQPISLETSVDADALAILSAFSKLDLGTGPKGKFEGLVSLGGTLQSPGMTGSIVWQDGRMRLPKIQSPFEGINAQMAFNGDKLVIEKFTGNSADGGTFGITGDISFANLKPALNLDVKTSGLKIAGRDLSNTYGETVKAVVNGDASIAGDWKKPLISGSASIYEGSVSIPSKAPKAHEEHQYSLDPTFDLGLTLGKKVRLETATLKAPLVGSISIEGSLSQPMINGSLDMSDGTVIFPMRQFKILPGSTLVIRPGMNQRPTVEVDMRAQTALTVPTTIRQRDRYTVTMVAQGPMDKLQPRFDSSPPGLSDSQVVALLTGQSQLLSILGKEGNQSLGAGLSSLFSTAMMPSFLAPIEDAFRTSLGLEEFALEAGYREPLQLTIGEHLWDGFYLDYSTVLGERPDYADSMYQFSLSYRFKHGIELDLQTDESHTYSMGLAGRLRF